MMNKTDYYFACGEMMLGVKRASNLLNAVLSWQCKVERMENSPIEVIEVFSNKKPLSVCWHSGEKSMYWREWNAAIMNDTYGHDWQESMKRAARLL